MFGLFVVALYIFSCNCKSIGPAAMIEHYSRLLLNSWLSSVRKYIGEGSRVSLSPF
jgi:hypothetical protein